MVFSGTDVATGGYLFASMVVAVLGVLIATLALPGLSLLAKMGFAIVVSIAAIFLLDFLIHHTKFGLGVRACASDSVTSELLGVNVNKYILIVFLLAGALAGCAGVLLGMKYTVYPSLGNVALKAFIASVFGGLGSAVAEVLVRECPVPIEFVGVEDTFTESGDYEKLLAKYGLSAANIVARAQKAVQRKK